MTSAALVDPWGSSEAPPAFAGPVLRGLLACQSADERFGTPEGLRAGAQQIVSLARRLGVRYLTASTLVGQRLVAASMLNPAAAGLKAPVWGHLPGPVLIIDGHLGSVIGVEATAERLLSAGSDTVHAAAWSTGETPLAGNSDSPLASLTVFTHGGS